MSQSEQDQKTQDDRIAREWLAEKGPSAPERIACAAARMLIDTEEKRQRGAEAMMRKPLIDSKMETSLGRLDKIAAAIEGLVAAKPEAALEWIDWALNPGVGSFKERLTERRLSAIGRLWASWSHQEPAAWSPRRKRLEDKLMRALVEAPDPDGVYGNEMAHSWVAASIREGIAGWRLQEMLERVSQVIREKVPKESSPMEMGSETMLETFFSRALRDTVGGQEGPMSPSAPMRELLSWASSLRMGANPVVSVTERLEDSLGCLSEARWAEPLRALWASQNEKLGLDLRRYLSEVGVSLARRDLKKEDPVGKIWLNGAELALLHGWESSMREHERLGDRIDEKKLRKVLSEPELIENPGAALALLERRQLETIAPQGKAKPGGRAGAL